MKIFKPTIDNFLSDADKKQINTTIGIAEKTTSAEIKVLIVSKSSNRCFFRKKLRIRMAEKRAEKEFIELGLGHTRDNTGVLIMLSLKEKVAVIKSGAAVEERIAPGSWEVLSDLIANCIKVDSRATGICMAVRKIGELLSRYFPIKPDDTNEIPDEIVFKK